MILAKDLEKRLLPNNKILNTTKDNISVKKAYVFTRIPFSLEQLAELSSESSIYGMFPTNCYKPTPDFVLCTVIIVIERKKAIEIKRNVVVQS